MCIYVGRILALFLAQRICKKDRIVIVHVHDRQGFGFTFDRTGIGLGRHNFQEFPAGHLVLAYGKAVFQDDLHGRLLARLHARRIRAQFYGRIRPGKMDHLDIADTDWLIGSPFRIGNVRARLQQKKDYQTGKRFNHFSHKYFLISKFSAANRDDALSARHRDMRDGRY